MTNDELQDLLKERFGAWKSTNKPGEYRIPCPTCNRHDAKKMRRYISTRFYTSKCWICNEDLTRDYLLGGQVEFAKVDAPIQQEHPMARVLPFREYELLNTLAPDHPAIKFLNKDFLYDMDKLSNVYKVGFIPMYAGISVSGIHTGGSIIFPVMQLGELVGWQIRFLPEFVKSKNKYIHFFPKGKYLYNFDRVIKFDHVVVVEGIKKSWKIENAVATLGKSFTPQQIELLGNWKRITVLLDGDEETQVTADRMVARIKALPRECVNIDLRKYGFKSPDEMTEEQVRQVVQEAWQ